MFKFNNAGKNVNPPRPPQKPTKDGVFVPGKKEDRFPVKQQNPKPDPPPLKKK